MRVRKVMICLLVAALFVVPAKAETYEISDGFAVEARWTLAYFNTPSTVYNEDLALCCLAICASSHKFDDSVLEVLGKMNFTNILRLNYDDRQVNNPAVTLGSQTRGDNVYIIIQVRGTKSLEDAITDVMGGIFNGFMMAGENIYSTFETYRYNYFPTVPDSHVYVLITGHSLGGATAGQLARQFRLKSDIDNSHVFVYTFASPLYDIEDDDPGAYDNVFNFILSEDIVPTVPWGYQRVGKDIYYTDNLSTFSFFDYMSTLFYVEDLTQRVPAVKKHHHLSTYYQVITNNQFDTATRFQKIVRGLLSSLLEMAERCFR